MFLDFFVGQRLPFEEKSPLKLGCSSLNGGTRKVFSFSKKLENFGHNFVDKQEEETTMRKFEEIGKRGRRKGDQTTRI